MASSAPLPLGWGEAKCPTSGNTYFYNHSTKEVTWTRPAASAPVDTAAPVPAGGYQSQSQQHYQSQSWGSSSWKGQNGWSSNTNDNGGGASAATEERQTGTIKMWNGDKPFGFIVPDAGGDDVFVHKNQTPDGSSIAAGTAVEFEKVWNPQKNKYNAANVQLVGGANKGSSNNSAPSKATTGGPRPLKAGWSEATDPSTGNPYFYKGTEVTWTRPEEDEHPQQQQYGGWSNNNSNSNNSADVDPNLVRKGTVKNFFEEKSFGFIVPDDGDKDIFIHKNNLTPPLESISQGARVSYTLAWNDKAGKYNAANCELDTTGEAPPPTAGSYSNRGGGPMPSSCLFVTGIPKGSDDDFLMNIFGQFGSVENVRVLPDTGKAELAGLVKFAEESMATAAIEASAQLPSFLSVQYKKENNSSNNNNSNSWQSKSNSWDSSNKSWYSGGYDKSSDNSGGGGYSNETRYNAY